MTKAQLEAYEQDYDAWKAQNPLRVWRHSGRNHITLMDAAVQLHVSISMIQFWEKGMHVPKGPKAQMIEQVIGRGTMRRWNEWKNEQPIRPAA